MRLKELRPDRAGDARVEFLQAPSRPGIARLNGYCLDKHVARSRQFAIADVAVGPMIEEVGPLHGRKAIAEACVEPVGPGGMASHRGERNLVVSHGIANPDRASERLQTGQVVCAAGLDERPPARRSGEGPNGAVTSHVHWDEPRPLLQGGDPHRVLAIDSMERIMKDIGTAGRVRGRDLHVFMK